MRDAAKFKIAVGVIVLLIVIWFAFDVASNTSNSAEGKQIDAAAFADCIGPNAKKVRVSRDARTSAQLLVLAGSQFSLAQMRMHFAKNTGLPDVYVFVSENKNAAKLSGELSDVANSQHGNWRVSAYNKMVIAVSEKPISPIVSGILSKCSGNSSK